MHWVIPLQLARSSRPGYGGEVPSEVPKHAVDEWLEALKVEGVKSVICLLSDDQLPLYSSLPKGLLDYYRAAGFEVAWIPVRDHLRPPLSEADLGRVWEAYLRLPKPILVHCSAGLDRTGSAVGHIHTMLAGGHA